jgi:hypothetical protein
MRRFFCLFCLLFLALPALAGPWSRSGTTWKHQNGMVITFPQEFAAEEAPNGILHVSGKQGFVDFLVQGARGDKEFKGWLAGQQQSFETEGLKIQQQPSRKLKSGVLAHTMSADRTSEQGIVFVVVAAAFQQGQDYLCMQMFYPKEREQDWTPLFQGVVNSVKPPARAAKAAK